MCHRRVAISELKRPLPLLLLTGEVKFNRFVSKAIGHLTATCYIYVHTFIDATPQRAFLAKASGFVVFWAQHQVGLLGVAAFLP
jgi:hypothetical protein